MLICLPYKNPGNWVCDVLNGKGRACVWTALGQWKNGFPFEATPNATHPSNGLSNGYRCLVTKTELSYDESHKKQLSSPMVKLARLENIPVCCKGHHCSPPQWWEVEWVLQCSVMALHCPTGIQLLFLDLSVHKEIWHQAAWSAVRGSSLVGH